MEGLAETCAWLKLSCYLTRHALLKTTSNLNFHREETDYMHQGKPTPGILYSHKKYRLGQYRLTGQVSLTHKLMKEHVYGVSPKSLAHTRHFSVLLSSAEPVRAFTHIEISEMLFEKC